MTAEAAPVTDFVLRHALSVDPAPILQRLRPLQPRLDAGPLDSIDAELQLGSEAPIDRWDLVMVTDSSGLAAALSVALERAGFRRPRATVRPVAADTITSGDAPPLVPSLLTWILASHGVRGVQMQPRAGKSKRVTVEVRDPRLQGEALLRNGAIEIRTDATAAGRAFAEFCAASGFQQVRVRRRDPVTEPGGRWSPGVFARDPAIRAQLAALVAHIAPNMVYVDSDLDAPAQIEQPALETHRDATDADDARGPAPSPALPLPDALEVLARRIVRDASPLRLELRTTSEAHRAALEAPLGALPFGAFQVEHTPETEHRIVYGGAPPHVIAALVRVVASHTGIVCASDKVWNDDIDSVWIQLASTAASELAPPDRPESTLPLLIGKREAGAVRIADLRVPATETSESGRSAEGHLEAPLADALYAAARAIERGTPFLLRGRHDSGRRAIVDALAHHTGHRVVEGGDAGALASAQVQSDWLLMIDPPAVPPPWLVGALEVPHRNAGFRLLAIADLDWPGRWPAEHAVRTPTVRELHDLLVAWVWGTPPIATVGGHSYRAGPPGHAPRPALTAAGNAPALLSALAALYAALQAEPLRFGRRRLAVLVDALRDGAPTAIQDALARFVLDRFPDTHRARIAELAGAAGIGVIS